MPATTAKATSIMTTSLLRPENSMMRLIMAMASGRCRARRSATDRALELRFGIEQESARRDDALPRAHALQDLNPVACAFTSFHRARFQVAVAMVHERRLSGSCIDHG